MVNVFISWSGDVSKEIAEELRNWIPSVLQFAKPYYTPNDIEKGAKWGGEISQKLSETNVGIICLTKDNVEKPWILFEAGALSKDLAASKVCSVLFGMENSDLVGPLTTFQTTLFDRADFKKLMQTINDSAKDSSLTKETFDRVFEMWWPQLETRIEAILKKPRKKSSAVDRTDRELIEEILDLSRTSLRNHSLKEGHDDLPMGYFDHFIEQLSETVDCIGSGDPVRMHKASEELIDLFDYLISKHPHASRTFRKELTQLKRKFSEVEIPF